MANWFLKEDFSLCLKKMIKKNLSNHKKSASEKDVND